MNEREIINEIKHTNNEHFSYILNNYAKMINHIISRNEIFYSTFPLLHEDLYQEGAIALYNACLKYDPDTNVKFSTFAYIVISRRIKKKINEHLRRSKIESYSIDGVEEVDYLKSYADPRLNTDRVDILDKKEKTLIFINSLSSIEKSIVALRQNNYSYEKIAIKLGISKKQVDNKLYRIKQKYKEIINK